MDCFAHVAGLNISFSGFDTYDALSCWQDFIADDTPPYNISFYYINKKKDFEFTQDSYVLNPLVFHCHLGQTIIGLNDTVTGTYSDIKMVADNDWSHLDIYNSSAVIGGNEIRLLTDAVFRSRLAYYDGFAAHASVIVYNGEAVIFAAPSGVGKSTHAEIWRNHLSADILNGDHALVRTIDDKVYVFGAPWSGTSPYKKNEYAPVKAIVLLEQARQNEISLLSGSAAYMELVTQCHLPTWRDDLVNDTLQNIEKAVSKTLIYKLKCNKDPSAAMLVRHTVYHQGESL